MEKLFKKQIEELLISKPVPAKYATQIKFINYLSKR